MQAPSRGEESARRLELVAYREVLDAAHQARMETLYGTGELGMHFPPIEQLVYVVAQ